MSFDLMVFDPAAAPVDREGFLKWYQQQTQWAEGHSYNDPAVSSPALRAWFLEMIEAFPAMNGPHAADPDDDSPRITDYSVGREVIYAAFAWSEAESAAEQVFRLAKKHGVGFFEASADGGGIWRPGAGGEYVRG